MSHIPGLCIRILIGCQWEKQSRGRKRELLQTLEGRLQRKEVEKGWNLFYMPREIPGSEKNLTIAIRR